MVHSESGDRLAMNPMKKPPEHAVIVRVPLSDGVNGTQEEIDHLLNLEEELEAAIAECDAGEFDGNDFGQGDFTYYMYGPDAERLFAAVEPILRRDRRTRAGQAVIRFGPPGSAQREVKLGM